MCLLQKLTQQVLSGEWGTSSATVANQLVNTHLRTLELERKWKEGDREVPGAPRDVGGGAGEEQAEATRERRGAQHSGYAIAI